MAGKVPSIFNDVLGPVMRGPSSSHSAASNRIGRLCRDLVGGDIASAQTHYEKLPPRDQRQIGRRCAKYGVEL